ncbi:MAG: L-2-amino-thiazoline-4-carboxylic acid hydrolase [Eubacterium sp.]|nr:L-2-amino-thiazoline-4-carboxylic acid hydrolase [Eubacterium sp.]
MQYKGIYWTVFSPLIKKSITARYSAALAEKAIKNGKAAYRGLLSRADELGPGNPMAMNAYFAYVFAAAWLGTDKEITPEGMGEVMTDVLTSPLLKTFFGMTDINSKSGATKWYRDMKKYETWYDKNKDAYPVNWVVHFDEAVHRDGSYYRFTRCPICEFCKREGIEELMPSLCATDEVMFRLQHGVLHRQHTLARGEGECDYWIVGDQVKDPQ